MRAHRDVYDRGQNRECRRRAGVSGHWAAGQDPQEASIESTAEPQSVSSTSTPSSNSFQLFEHPAHLKGAFCNWFSRGNQLKTVPKHTSWAPSRIVSRVVRSWIRGCQNFCPCRDHCRHFLLPLRDPSYQVSLSFQLRTWNDWTSEQLLRADDNGVNGPYSDFSLMFGNFLHHSSVPRPPKVARATCVNLSSPTSETTRGAVFARSLGLVALLALRSQPACGLSGSKDDGSRLVRASRISADLGIQALHQTVGRVAS